MNSRCYLCGNSEKIDLEAGRITCKRITECIYQNIGENINYGEYFIHLYRHIKNNSLLDPHAPAYTEQFSNYQEYLSQMFSKIAIPPINLWESAKDLALELEKIVELKKLDPIETGFLILALLNALDKFCSTLKNDYWIGFNPPLPIVFNDHMLHVKTHNFLNNHLEQKGYRKVDRVQNSILPNCFDNITILLKDESQNVKFQWIKTHNLAKKHFPSIKNLKVQTNTLGVDMDILDQNKSITTSKIKVNERRIWFTGYEPLEKLQENIELALNNAMEDQVNILIFPELSMPPSVKDWFGDVVRKFSKNHKISLIIAGSFHEEINVDNVSYRCNISSVYDYKGNIIFNQSKREKYEGIDRDKVCFERF